jgi:hypothetical protein
LVKFDLIHETLVYLKLLFHYEPAMDSSNEKKLLGRIVCENHSRMMDEMADLVAKI